MDHPLDAVESRESRVEGVWSCRLRGRASRLARTKRRARGAALVAAALLLSATARAADRPRIVILKSAELAPYASVIAGFSAQVRAEVTEVLLEDGADAAAQTLKRVADGSPALVLALGPAAANAAKRAVTRAPIVFCMVPYYERYGLEGPNVTGIALTNDASTELEALKAVAPAAKRVGILFDPRYSSKVFQDAQAFASGNGLLAVALEAEGTQAVDRALRGGHGKVDAMLAIPDKTVASEVVMKKLLSFAEDAKVPLLGFSPAQVKEGALLSLAPSYAAVGEQAGRIAERILREKVDPGALAVAAPEGLELHYNLGAAKRLGLSADAAQELLRLAARQGYVIRAVQEAR